MTDPHSRPTGVFWGRVEQRDDAFHARCGVRDGTDPTAPDAGAFATYDDARSWVHLSAAQAGFRSIVWDPDSYATLEACVTG
jgi:hypothetical protein